MRLFLPLVLALFPLYVHSLYLPSRGDTEVSAAISMDIDSLASSWRPGEKFDYEKILFSAHLLKKSLGENFDVVTNYHLAHKKGVVQTQLVYHLCCGEKDVVNASLSAGLNTNVQFHGGLGIEILLDNFTLFVSGTHRKEFRAGLISYFSDGNFHAGIIGDFMVADHNNPGDPEGIKTYFGLVLGFNIDSRGQKAIDEIQKKLKGEESGLSSDKD